MLSLDPFDYSEAEYQDALAINAAVFDEPPDPIAEWKHDDETWDNAYPYQRDLVRRGETVVAYVETYQSQFSFHPQKYECRIYVHPDHELADIRPFVLAEVLARLADKDLIALKSGMLDNRPEALRFFDAFGFVKVAEEKLSTLAVTQFNAEAFAPLLERVHAAGIEIVTLRALVLQDPDWREKLFDLETTVNREIPATGEKRYPDFDGWRRMRLDAPTFDPDAWFIARDGARLVAHSQGSFNREGEAPQFVTGVTATRPEYRRRGLATALKVHVIQHVQAAGVAEIFTTNDAQNPMYKLNLALGFTPQPSWVRVEKKLG